MRYREALTGFFYISPWIVGFTIFVLGPMVASFVLAFCRYNPAELNSSINWIGFANYRRMLADDPVFWKSLWVTFRYSIVSIPLQLAGGLALAMLLNRELRGIALYRTAFYLPAVLGGVASSLIWLWLLSPSQGLINVGLGNLYDFLGRDSWGTRAIASVLTTLFGVSEEGSLLPGWTSSDRGALNALILMSLWGLGSSMIVNLAGLQGIPSVYYEAAHIDGAGPLRRFMSITLPLLSPTIFFNLIMGVIGSFQVFTQGYVMTGGGPNNATRFYVLYIYQNAFELFRMGYASALAWVLFAVILTLTLIIMKTSSGWVFYEARQR